MMRIMTIVHSRRKGKGMRRTLRVQDRKGRRERGNKYQVDKEEEGGKNTERDLWAGSNRENEYLHLVSYVFLLPSAPQGGAPPPDPEGLCGAARVL